MLKVTVHINENNLRNAEFKSCFWIFILKCEFKGAMYFAYVEALGNPP